MNEDLKKLLAAANRAEENDNPDGAIAHLEEARSLYPEDPKLLNLLAEHYQDAGDDQKAIECLDKALEIDPNHFAALANKARYVQDYEGPKKAIPLVKRSLKIKPDNVDGWVQLSNLFFDSGNWLKAKEAAEKALELDPEDEQSLLAKAEAHSYLKEDEAADKIYKDLMEKYPDWMYMLRSYSFHLANSKRLTQAIKLVEHTKEIEPNDPFVESDLQRLKGRKRQDDFKQANRVAQQFAGKSVREFKGPEYLKRRQQRELN